MKTTDLYRTTETDVHVTTLSCLTSCFPHWNHKSICFKGSCSWTTSFHIMCRLDTCFCLISTWVKAWRLKNQIFHSHERIEFHKSDFYFNFLHNKNCHNKMKQALKKADNSKVNFLYLWHQNQWEIHFIHQKEGQKMPYWIVRILYRTLTVNWWVIVLCMSFHRCATRINIGKSKTIPLLWNKFESMYEEVVSILWLKYLSSKSTCVTIQAYITEYLFHLYVKCVFHFMSNNKKMLTKCFIEYLVIP
jgi:hypothetical protein